jgi:hypothetical protein
MTWSYFTAYLDGSRPITKAERDELYSNLSVLFPASGCYSHGYSLNSTDQAAILASNLLTDRASLDGPNSLHLHGRFGAIVAAAASAFTNYSAAVSAALTNAGITATERDAITAANMDDHRLWNYYRGLLNGLSLVNRLPVITSPLYAVAYLLTNWFSYQITATDSPTSFSATGLPSFLSINTSTGVISGQPSFTGYRDVTITATNACGTATATLRIEASFDEDPPPCDCDFTGIDTRASCATEDGGLCLDDTWDVTGQFSCYTAVQFSVHEPTTDCGWQFVVYANGVALLVTPCITDGDPYESGIFYVSTGTTSIRIIGYAGCGNGCGSVADIALYCVTP